MSVIHSRNPKYDPIPLEEVEDYAQIENIKYWKDFPHKRFDYVRTDDNWVCCVWRIFDSGAVSLCGRWIITPKAAKTKRSYRIYDYSKTRIRWNNRLKILINTALLTGDWKLAYRLAYNKDFKKLEDVINNISSSGEEYLLKQLDKLLEENGITDNFVLSGLKDLAENSRDNTRLDTLKLLARMLSINPEDPKLTMSDNRSVHIHGLNPKEALKQLEGNED